MFTILLISIVCIDLHLTDVIIVQIMPQLAAYSKQEYFETLVEEVINVIIMESIKDAYGEEEVLEDL